MHRYLAKIHTKRFELFFSSLMAVLFGELIIPEQLFHDVFFPLFLMMNLFAGLTLVLHNQRNVKIVMAFGLVILGLFVFRNTFPSEIIHLTLIRYFLLSIFYALVSYELIRQVWMAEDVSGNIILGMMSGYICLGLLAYFAFIAVEALHPGSFVGIPTDMSNFEKSREIMNYSFVTLLTVGYGNVAPHTIWAQKLSVLTALFGQFYLVIVTAVVIGKFLK